MTNLSNIKKVRGWKRRIRQAERWRQSEGELRLDLLNRYDYTYARIWFSPWGDLVPRQPPVWYRRILLRHLIGIYHDWDVRLTEEYGDQYYLRLWLFHPQFQRSQVVAAVGERIEYYQKLFPRVTALRSTPQPQYEGHGYDLVRFEWLPSVYEERYSAEADDLNAYDIKQMTKRATRIEHLPTGEPVYVLRRSFVWVGSHVAAQQVREGEERSSML